LRQRQQRGESEWRCPARVARVDEKLRISGEWSDLLEDLLERDIVE
jgi:hypothetical protein